MGKPNVNVIIGAIQKVEGTYKKIILKGGLPFAPQLSDDKCIYVVKYDFDLGGGETTMPTNSILDFDGGSLKNGKLVLDNTMLDGIIILGKDLDVSGTCNNQTVYQNWFEDNDIDAWHKFINNVDGPIDYEYERGVYETNVLVNKGIDHNIIVNGNGADVSFPYKYNGQALFIHPKQSPDTDHKIYLTQAAYKGDKGVTVSAADFDKLNIGDTILIRDLANSSYHWTRDYREGEFAYVRFKDHTTHEILIDHQLLGTYRNNINESGDNRTCFIVKWDKADIRINDLTVRMDETRGDYYGDYGVIDVMKSLGTTTETVITEGSTVNPIVLTTGATVTAVNGDYVTYKVSDRESYRFVFDGTQWHKYQYVYMSGILMTYANVELDNIKVLNFVHGIDAQFIYGGYLNNCTNISTVKVLDDSYGLMMRSCQNVVVNGGTYQARNHGITITSFYSNIFTIVPRNISISNINGIGTADSLNQNTKNGIDVHVGEYINIDHCYIMGIMIQLCGYLKITNNHIFNDLVVFPKNFDISILNNTIHRGLLNVTLNKGSYNSYSGNTTDNWNPLRPEDSITEQTIIQGNSILSNTYININIGESGEFYPNLKNVTFLVKDNNVSTISAACGGSGVIVSYSDWDNQPTSKYEDSASVHMIGNTFRDYPGRVFCKELVYADNSILGLKSAGAPNLYGLYALSSHVKDNIVKTVNFTMKSRTSLDFTGNSLDSVTSAMSLSAVERLNIANNAITSCATGIRLYGTADVVVVEGNNIKAGKSVAINSASDYTKDTPFSVYVRGNNFLNCSSNNMVFNFVNTDQSVEYEPVATIYADNNKFKNCGVNTINCTNHLHLYTYKNCDENNSTNVYVGGINRIDLDDIVSDTYESIMQVSQGGLVPNIIYDVELTPNITTYSAMHLSFFINGIGNASIVENIDLSIRFFKYSTATPPYCDASVLQINDRGYVNSEVGFRVDYHISYNTTTDNYHIKFRLYTDQDAVNGRMQCYMKLVPFDTWNGDKLVTSVTSDIINSNLLTPSKFNITGSDVTGEDGTVYKAAITLPSTKGSTNVVAINKEKLPEVAVKADTFYLNEIKSFVHYDGTKWREGDGAVAGVKRYGTYDEKPSSADVYVGFEYFATDLGTILVWTGSNWVSADGYSTSKSGTTAQRPSGEDIYVGFEYLDTDLDKLITAKAIDGSDVSWIESDSAAAGVRRKGTTAQRPASTDIYESFKYQDTTIEKAISWDGEKWLEEDGATAGVKRMGTTAERPDAADIYVGFVYYDTDLNMPIYAYLVDTDNDHVYWTDFLGVNPSVSHIGTYVQKPSGADIYIGFLYYATDLYRNIVWRGDKWTNVDGTDISFYPTVGNSKTLVDEDVFDYKDIPVNFEFYAADLGKTLHFGKIVSEDSSYSIPTDTKVLLIQNPFQDFKRYTFRASNKHVKLYMTNSATPAPEDLVLMADSDKYSEYVDFVAFGIVRDYTYIYLVDEREGENLEASKVWFSLVDTRWFEEDGVVAVYKDENYDVFYTRRSGTFANKPTVADNAIYVGFRYFCTDKQTTEGAANGIEIIHKGSDVWVDALGRVVE